MDPALRWRLDAILGTLLFIAVSLVATLVLLGGILVLAGMVVVALVLAVGTYAFSLTPDQESFP
jgi:hypothetical protein